MLWHALPPEANAAMLMAGAGPAPMLEAAASWEALSAALRAEAVEFGGMLAALSAAWQGPSSEHAMAASLPMVTWLEEAAAHAEQCGMRAAAQAEAYVKAVAMTPSLPEIAVNHVTHAVLSATNFFGINLVPIGFNEMDYFVRMWNQAGSAMDIYQAETAFNTAFGTLEPPKPIVQSEVGQTAEAHTVQHAVRGTPLTQVSGMAALANAAASDDSTTVNGLAIGNGLAPSDGTIIRDGLASRGGVTTDDTSSVVVEASARGDAHPVLASAVTSRQSRSPFMSKLFAQGGGGGVNSNGAVVDDTEGIADNVGDSPDGLAGLDDSEVDEMGLLGTSPISTHPMAGGSGPSVGMGLMYSEALPGAGGSAARTSAMAQLIDKPAQGLASAAPGAGSSAAGGAAPMGMMGAGASSGASVGARPNEMTSAVLTYSDDNSTFDDGDDW